MEVIFKRPKVPRELSQKEIAEKIFTEKLNVYCGSCGKILKPGRSERHLARCPCIPDSSKYCASFRIVQDQIFADMILILNDDEFNPDIHTPMTKNEKRDEQWKQFRRN